MVHSSLRAGNWSVHLSDRQEEDDTGAESLSKLGAEFIQDVSRQEGFQRLEANKTNKNAKEFGSYYPFSAFHTLVMVNVHACPDVVDYP